MKTLAGCPYIFMLIFCILFLNNRSTPQQSSIISCQFFIFNSNARLFYVAIEIQDPSLKKFMLKYYKASLFCSFVPVLNSHFIQYTCPVKTCIYKIMFLKLQMINTLLNFDIYYIHISTYT